MSSELTPEDVKKMTVANLKTELSSRDLPTKGLKKDLSERLIEAISGNDSVDPSGQAAGEAPEIADATEKSTDNLPSEMPSVPPANEDSVADFEGKEATATEEQAANPVETSGEPSAVVRPDVNSVDQTPGVVQETKAPEATMSIAGEEETGVKRKRDDAEEAAAPAATNGDAHIEPVNAVEPVAVQEEKAAEPNDPVPAAPADVEQPELKRAKLDDDVPVVPLNEPEANTAASAADPVATMEDIPVSAPTEEENKSVPTLKVKGASSSPSSSFSKPSSSAITATTDEVPDSNKKENGDVASPKQSHSFSIKGSSSVVKPPSLPSKEDDTQSSMDTDVKPLSIKGLARQPQTREISSVNPLPAEEGSANNAAQTRVATDDSTAVNVEDERNLGNADMSLDNQEVADDSDSPPASASICVSNLVRPFTVPALKEKLEEYGDYDPSSFWINTIKSHCFIMYDDITSAVAASEALQDVTWPEGTGKPLSVTFLPTEVLPELIEKEKAAGRTRLELVVTKDPETRSWKYDVESPSSTAAGQNAKPVPRGLASSVPVQVRPVTNNPFPFGVPAQPPSDPNQAQARAPLPSQNGRLFQQTQGRQPVRGTITATSASGAPIQIPSTSAFAQSKAPTLRDPAPAPGEKRPREEIMDSEAIWQPAPRAEETYKKTKTTPVLYYRPVDMVAAGRKLRELERGNRKRPEPVRRRPAGDSYRP